MARIGVIACGVMRRELECILPEFPEVVEVVWMESALHIHPEKMKETIMHKISEVGERVDAVFLGYGFCRSLQGIEDEVALPVVLPQYHDCIALLLTPERYAAEVKKEAGTWFMTPGWAEIGAEQIVRELGLERVRRYGKDPIEMAKRLFANYRRGLYIDTGTENNELCAEMAERFCREFNLAFERTTAAAEILREELKRCVALAGKGRDGTNDRGIDETC